MNGPGVYVFKKVHCFLYVGSTRELAKRPKKRDNGHKSRWAAILECDNVELIPCENYVKAQQLEEQLIRLHKPKYNLRVPRAEADLARTWQIVRDNW